MYNLAINSSEINPYNFSSFLSCTPGKAVKKEFLEWFVGFSEGDGSFGIVQEDGKTDRLVFVINQADKCLLDNIRDTFGFGNVKTFTQPHPETKEPYTYARYTVYDQKAIFALIEFFNGNLHLTKVQKRFNKWVQVFNKVSGKTIVLKSTQPVEAINLKTGWLSSFFEADGGFSASLTYDEKFALKHRLRLKSFVDQKGELEVLKRIASLLKVKNVRTRNKIKKYYQVECHSKVQLLIVCQYFEIYSCYGRKQEIQHLWSILSLMYVNNEHLGAELADLRQKVNKIQELNQLFKLHKSVLKLEQFKLENTIYL